MQKILPAQLDPLLGIGDPKLVYLYLRANIADTIARAGFAKRRKCRDAG